MDNPLARRVTWERTGSAFVPYKAVVDGKVWQLYLGEFPEEPLYTLIIDGKRVLSLDDPPRTWTFPS